MMDELTLEVTAPMMAADPSLPTRGGTAHANSISIVSAGVACNCGAMAAVDTGVC